MSQHLDAVPGDIATTVLLPGDPLRARHIARTMLDAPRCFNERRAADGFTGSWRGKRVSVQGTGMGAAGAIALDRKTWTLTLTWTWTWTAPPPARSRSRSRSRF